MERPTISLATYKSIFVRLATTSFCVVPNLMAFCFAISVVEVIRDHDPTTFWFALEFILMACVAFPVLVILGRDFNDFAAQRH